MLFIEKREARKTINRFFAVLIILHFCISLEQGGGYTMLWFDTYSAGVSLLCSAMFEAIAIVYFYGKCVCRWTVFDFSSFFSLLTRN